MSFRQDWDKLCQRLGPKSALISPHRTLTFQQILQYCQGKHGEKAIVIDLSNPLEQALRVLEALYQEEAFLLLHPSLSRSEKEGLIQFFQEEVSQHPKQMALLSSGTSGKTKLFWRKIESWTDFYPSLAQAFPLSGSDRLYLQGSLSFTGNLNLLLAALLAGCPVFLDDQLDGKLFASYLDEEQLNKAYLIPSKIRLILPYLTEGRLEEIWTSSQILDQDLIQKIKQVDPQLKVRIFYGSAELSYISWGILGQLKAGSVGHLFPQISLEIRDKQLFLSSPFAIEGLPQPYASQDYGYMDEDQLILQGRGQDWVNQMGKKIYLPALKEKIEKLLSIPVTLLALDHPLAGQIPALILLKKPGQDLVTIKRLLKEKLPKEEWPRHFLEVESFPLLDSGKINYQKLKDMIKQRT